MITQLQICLNHAAVVASLVLSLMALSFSPSAVGAVKSTGIPRFDASVAKSVGFLREKPPADAGNQALAAYALFKAGFSVDDPMVAAGIKGATERAVSGYQREGYRHIYVAGVDAMLLADTDADFYQPELQKIADYIQQAQHPTGFWTGAGEKQPDTSMIQYGMLALWAADRAGCKLNPQVIERAAAWHLKNVSKPSGGWSYRPADSRPRAASHNMTLAGGGSMSIARILLYGPKVQKKSPAPEQKVETTKFGVLQKAGAEEEKKERSGGAFPGYNPNVSREVLDNAIGAALRWNEMRYKPVTPELNSIYYYYCLERILAINDVKLVKGSDWYVPYGDGMLTKQLDDGSYRSTGGFAAASSFAILYFVRSTKQIVEKEFGKGLMKGSRGLDNLFGAKDKKKKELGPLDELLGGIMSSVEDLEKLDVNTDDIVEKVTFSSRDELIGQVDMLKQLLKSKNADSRRTAYWALGRTGDFALLPLMMQGIRDPSVDCNVEALRSLRYIARKPNGFGLSLEPLAGAETADNETKVEVANKWRTKAYKTWGNWYRRVRPFDEGDGLDVLELTSQGRGSR